MKSEDNKNKHKNVTKATDKKNLESLASSVQNPSKEIYGY